MSCQVSRLVEIYNSLIYALKRNILSNMATITHTIVVKLSRDVVVSFMRLLSRGNDLFLSIALPPPQHQKCDVTLHGMTCRTADVYQCTCSYGPINVVFHRFF
jgi:hypothetical protein